MGKHRVERLFEECGAILNGHFVLASRRHTEKYLDKSLISPDIDKISDLCWEMANIADCNSSLEGFDVVVGPATGGIILSHLVARHLRIFYKRSKKVLSIYTEQDKTDNQILKKGYQKLVVGKKVLIVDDILATGGSIKKVIAEVKKAGGIVVAVVVICNRGKVTSDDIGGYPLFSLWETEIESWPEKKCPLCKAKVPVNEEVGRGKEFNAKKAR